jgi:hypothetical protein
VGSGLILLVIVAAWLAVLVPMALRSHESSTSLSSVDRFSDAMRVLSRRDAAARARARREADDDPLSAAAWADQDDEDDDWDDELEPASWRERLSSLTSRLPGRGGERRPTSPVVRRRRLLITLVGLTVVSLVGGLVGPRLLLAVAGVLLVALALFVVQLRRLAVARAARTRSTAPPAERPVQRPAAAPVRSGSVRVQPASVPADQEPVVAEPVESTAVRHDEPLPAADPVAPPLPAPAAALGAAWSPVPVPVPTYVTAPVAPPRAQRIVDLTRPGAWSQQEQSRPPEELPGTAPATEPAAERRRAVNDW